MHSNHTEKMRNRRPRRGWDAEAQAKRKTAKRRQKARRESANRREEARSLANDGRRIRAEAKLLTEEVQ